jgi:ABC-type transport system involved in multi-copper enzyme maturation permease subunit
VKKVATIAGLTWKSAFRYRLFWIMAGLLAAAVVGLPLLLKTDGTAKGLVQILLTYTLSAVAALLGFATLWLSCGTLARDVEECQMQMVAVKPIARWQIWLGKWLGLLSLNAVLLALAGASIFFLLQWRAAELPADQQKVLRDDIFVSRASAREPPLDLGPEVERIMRQRVKDPSQMDPRDLAEIRLQLTAALTTNLTEVPPGFRKRWCIDLHSLRERLREQPLLLRVKFHAANANPEAQFGTLWLVGPTNSAQAELPQTMPSDSFQEFPVPAGLLDEQGRLWIDVVNPNDVALEFQVGEGLELLYPESTFGVNFIRGLAIIFCWLTLLASIGMAAASFLSFPVAAFVSLALLLIAFSSGTVSSVVEQGTITGYDAAKGGYGHTPADLIIVPIFRGALKIIKLAQSFSPIDNLSSGRSITWGQLGQAWLQIVLLLGGVFCVAGIVLFTRRELATAQGNT